MTLSMYFDLQNEWQKYGMERVVSESSKFSFHIAREHWHEKNIAFNYEMYLSIWYDFIELSYQRSYSNIVSTTK